MTDLSPTTQLAVLLTAKWSVNGAKPLTNTEFFELRRWIGTGAEAASALMNGQRPLENCPIDRERLEGLLQRGLGVFQPLDRWMQAGLWVRSWSDTDYPSRFKQLRLRAPALIFGYGNPDAFSSRALAIVGSRNASEERLAKTAEIGRACAKSNITVVSGGARGVDSTAMRAGMADNGTVVGVLADSLLKEAGKKNYREAIRENKLCLMSEVSPEAHFHVGNAMARNRLAYACADAALVIECEPDKGGTWQGAMEARREGKTVYVLRGARAEKQLAELGAVIIEMDFGLNPENMIHSLRPQLDHTPPNRFAAWFREMVCDNPLDVEKIAAKLRSDSLEIAHQIVAIAQQEGMIAIPLLQEVAAANIDEPAQTPEKKKRSSRKKSNGAVTLFEGVEHESKSSEIAQSV